MRGPWEFEDPACGEVGTELFYLEDKDDVGRPPVSSQIYPPQLQNLCGGCPHLRECGDWSLRYEDYGYWAGMSSHDRERIRKQRGISLHNISASRQGATKEARRSA